jgi:hypothetical protein
LCTQAQFEWRIVFMGIVNAIRDYSHTPNGQGVREFGIHWANRRDWQFKEISRSGLFRPICYQLGRCMFNADFDRSCTIRSRVDAFAKDGVPSTMWHRDDWMTSEEDYLEKIDPAEWMLDPAAARKTSGGAGHE